MDVYVIDAEAAIALARRGFSKSAHWELFAPTLMRSQVLAIAHADRPVGDGDSRTNLDLAQRACRLPRRLLGDAVMRATAWKLADEHGWADTYHAEYIALTKLQGRALVAENADLRARAEGLVDVMTLDELMAID